MSEFFTVAMLIGLIIFLCIKIDDLYTDEVVERIYYNTQNKFKNYQTKTKIMFLEDLEKYLLEQDDNLSKKLLKKFQEDLEKLYNE